MNRPSKPDDPPTGTCDWTRCNQPSVDWRFDEAAWVWLPVCEAHSLRKYHK